MSVHRRRIAGCPPASPQPPELALDICGGEVAPEPVVESCGACGEIGPHRQRLGAAAHRTDEGLAGDAAIVGAQNSTLRGHTDLFGFAQTRRAGICWPDRGVSHANADAPKMWPMHGGPGNGLSVTRCIRSKRHAGDLHGEPGRVSSPLRWTGSSSPERTGHRRSPWLTLASNRQRGHRDAGIAASDW